MLSVQQGQTKLGLLYKDYKKKGLEESMSLIKTYPELANAFRIISQSPEFSHVAKQVHNIINSDYDNVKAVALFTYNYKSYNISFREEIDKVLLSDAPTAKELAEFVLNLVDGMKKIREFLNPHKYTFTIDLDKIPELRSNIREGYTFEYPSFIAARPNDHIFCPVVSTNKAVGVIVSNFYGTPMKKINPNSNEVFIAPGSFLTIRKFGEENGIKKMYLAVSQKPSVFDNFLKRTISKSGILIQNTKYNSDNSRDGVIKPLNDIISPESCNTYYGLLKAIEKADFCNYSSSNEPKEVQDKKIHEYAVKLQSRCAETLSYLKKRGVIEKYKMTEEEAMAIIMFTFDNGSDKTESNPYFVVNNTLGQRKSSNKNYLPFIFHLLNALRKLPRYDGSTTLYRGVKGLNTESYKVGSIKTWPAFTSTCADKDFAEDFASGQSDVLFTIKGKFIGYEIQEFSIFNEEEVLLEPDTKFCVKSVTKNPDTNLTEIEVEVMESEQKPFEEHIKVFMKSKSTICAMQNQNENGQTPPPPPPQTKKIKYAKTILTDFFNNPFDKISQFNIKNALDSLGFRVDFIKVRFKFCMSIFKIFSKHPEMATDIPGFTEALLSVYSGINTVIDENSRMYVRARIQGRIECDRAANYYTKMIANSIMSKYPNSLKYSGATQLTNYLNNFFWFYVYVNGNSSELAPKLYFTDSNFVVEATPLQEQFVFVKMPIQYMMNNDVESILYNSLGMEYRIHLINIAKRVSPDNTMTIIMFSFSSPNDYAQIMARDGKVQIYNDRYQIFKCETVNLSKKNFCCLFNQKLDENNPILNIVDSGDNVQLTVLNAQSFTSRYALPNSSQGNTTTSNNATFQQNTLANARRHRSPSPVGYQQQNMQQMPSQQTQAQGKFNSQQIQMPGFYNPQQQQQQSGGGFNQRRTRNARSAERSPVMPFNDNRPLAQGQFNDNRPIISFNQTGTQQYSSQYGGMNSQQQQQFNQNSFPQQSMSQMPGMNTSPNMSPNMNINIQQPQYGGMNSQQQQQPQFNQNSFPQQSMSQMPGMNMNMNSNMNMNAQQPQYGRMNPQQQQQQFNQSSFPQQSMSQMPGMNMNMNSNMNMNAQQQQQQFNQSSFPQQSMSQMPGMSMNMNSNMNMNAQQFSQQPHYGGMNPQQQFNQNSFPQKSMSQMPGMNMNMNTQQPQYRGMNPQQQFNQGSFPQQSMSQMPGMSMNMNSNMNMNAQQQQQQQQQFNGYNF